MWPKGGWDLGDMLDREKVHSLGSVIAVSGAGGNFDLEREGAPQTSLLGWW